MMYLTLVSFLVSFAAQAESHVYITRDLNNGGTQGIELVCLDKPKLCRVSRTMNAEATGFKDLPEDKAQTLFKNFARDLEKVPANSRQPAAKRALRLDFAYGKTKRKEALPYDSAKFTKTQLAFMKIEAALEAALQ